MADPIVVRGNLGWSNDHKTASNLDVYGPDGRWKRRLRLGGDTEGDKLADALAERGGFEGARFVVVAVNRSSDDSILDDVERFVAERTDLLHRAKAAEASAQSDDTQPQEQEG